MIARNRSSVNGYASMTAAPTPTKTAGPKPVRYRMESRASGV